MRQNDELTIRFLLEEGKLNLCVRLMAAFSHEMRTLGDDRATWLVNTARETEMGGTSQLEARLLAFEQSLGQLLHAASRY